MKKYTASYLVIFFIQVVLQITHGVPFGIIYVYDDKSMYRDGGITIRTALIGNLIIVLICLLITVLITLYKNNRIRYKWPILIALFAQALLIPAEKAECIGGFVGGYDIIYISLINSLYRGLFH